MQTLVVPEVQVIRWTRHEYERMADIGLFEGRRVQLIDGEIFETTPMREPHAVALVLSVERFSAICGNGYHLRVQTPLAVGGDSEPEPDVAIVRGDARAYVDAHPTTAVLVVEISDSTLRFDLGRKRTLYAAAGISEYWVLDLNARAMHIFRGLRPASETAAATYSEQTMVDETASVSPLAFPLARLVVRDLLP